jgi:hypothetical protein
VTIEFEEPEGIGCIGAAFIPPKHYRRVIADPFPHHQGLEVFRAKDVAANRILQLAAHRKGHGTWQIAGKIRMIIPASRSHDLDDPDGGIGMIVGDPGGAHQCLGVGIPADPVLQGHHRHAAHRSADLI